MLPTYINASIDFVTKVRFIVLDLFFVVVFFVAEKNFLDKSKFNTRTALQDAVYASNGITHIGYIVCDLYLAMRFF